MTERVRASVDALRPQVPEPPRLGIVLGSGLGGFADTLADAVAVPTESIAGFPVSTVAGHAGRVVSARVGDVPAILLQGRVHGYEGYSLADLTHAIHVMAGLGVRGVILTNAAGSMHVGLPPGSLMLVRDHVNLSLFSIFQQRVTENEMPDRGVALGTPAGRHLYTPRLCAHARAAAGEAGIRLREGVLVYGRGPSYETRAEVGLYRRVGGDAACMSTVPEIVAAHACGVEAMAISCISNLGTGLSADRLSHDEVTEVASLVASDIQKLVRGIVARAYGEGARSEWEAE